MLGEQKMSEREHVEEQADAKRKRTLSRDSIVDVAYRMIDQDGVASFTMRALGRELGVSAMAFYAHFSSREEVLAAVLMRFMETMDTDAVSGERWDDTLRRTMTSIHREFCAHPNMYDIDVDPSISYEGLSAHTAKVMKLHLDQGIPEKLLAKIWAIVDAFLTGFDANAIASAKLRESEMLGDVDLEQREPWERVVRSAYSEESFQDGVDIIVNGVRMIAAPDPCEWRTPLSN